VLETPEQFRQRVSAASRSDEPIIPRAMRSVVARLPHSRPPYSPASFFAAVASARAEFGFGGEGRCGIGSSLFSGRSPRQTLGWPPRLPPRKSRVTRLTRVKRSKYHARRRRGDPARGAGAGCTAWSVGVRVSSGRNRWPCRATARLRKSAAVGVDAAEPRASPRRPQTTNPR